MDLTLRLVSKSLPSIPSEDASSSKDLWIIFHLSFIQVGSVKVVG